MVHWGWFTSSGWEGDPIKRYRFIIGRAETCVKGVGRVRQTTPETWSIFVLTDNSDAKVDFTGFSTEILDSACKIRGFSFEQLSDTNIRANNNKVA